MIRTFFWNSRLLVALASLAPSITSAQEPPREQLQTAAETKNISSSCATFRQQIPQLAATACERYERLPAEKLSQPNDAKLVGNLGAACKQYFTEALRGISVICEYHDAAKRSNWPASLLNKTPESRLAQAKADRQVHTLQHEGMGFENLWFYKFGRAKGNVEVARIRYSQAMRRQLLEPVKKQVVEEFERGGVPGYSPSPLILSFMFSRAAEADWMERLALSAVNEGVKQIRSVYDNLHKSNTELAKIIERMGDSSASTAAQKQASEAVTKEKDPSIHLEEGKFGLVAEEIRKLAAGMIVGTGVEQGMNLAARTAFEGVLVRGTVHGVASATGAAAGLGLDIWFRLDHWSPKDTAFVLARGSVWGTVAFVSLATGGTAAVPMTIYGVTMDTIFTATEILVELRRNKELIRKSRELLTFYANHSAQLEAADSSQFARKVCEAQGRKDCAVGAAAPAAHH